MTTVSTIAGFMLVISLTLVLLLIVLGFVLVVVKIIMALGRIKISSGDNYHVNNNRGNTRELWGGNTKDPWFINWQSGTLEDRNGNIVGDLDDRDDED